MRAYAEGQQAVETGVAQALDGLPLASASGLGTWAADALGSCVGALGLQPAKLDALKPVVVNTQHVAAADEGAFAVRFLAVKRQALAFPSTTTDLFSSVVDSVEDAVLEELADSNGTIELAVIEFPVGGVSVPITITLPPAVVEAAGGLVDNLANALRSVCGEVTGVRAWE